MRNYFRRDCTAGSHKPGGFSLLGTAAAIIIAALILLAANAASAGTCGVLANGACGTASGVAVATAPTTNLCSAGTATPVAGTGPWTWTCMGNYGGSSTCCAAPQAVCKADGIECGLKETPIIDCASGYYSCASCCNGSYDW